jgi:hypothetical protein
MNLTKNVTGDWQAAKQLLRGDLDTIQRAVTAIQTQMNATLVPDVPPVAIFSSANEVTNVPALTAAPPTSATTPTTLATPVPIFTSTNTPLIPNIPPIIVTGVPILKTVVVVNDAGLLAWGAAVPRTIKIVPAPGAGRVIVPLACEVHCTATVFEFVQNQNVVFHFSDTAGSLTVGSANPLFGGGTAAAVANVAFDRVTNIPGGSVTFWDKNVPAFGAGSAYDKDVLGLLSGAVTANGGFPTGQTTIVFYYLIEVLE